MSAISPALLPQFYFSPPNNVSSHCSSPYTIIEQTTVNSEDSSSGHSNLSPFRPTSAFSAFVQVPVPVRPKPTLSPRSGTTSPTHLHPGSVGEPLKRKFEHMAECFNPLQAEAQTKKRRRIASTEDLLQFGSDENENTDNNTNEDEDSVNCSDPPSLCSSPSSPSSTSPIAYTLPQRGPFICPVEHCDCRYTRRYDMKMHFLNKHPEQVAQFPEILNLKKSSKDGKKWQCPFPECICGYSRKGDLKGHLLKRHPGECNQFPDILRPRSTKENKKFQCPIPNCDCGYMRKFDLKSHVYAKHPKQVHLFEEEFEHIEDDLVQKPTTLETLPESQSQFFPEDQNTQQ